MPKGPKKTGEKGKGKQPLPISTRTRQTEREDAIQSAESDKSDAEGGRTTRPEQTTPKSTITEEQDEQIASFVESHPAFYDLTTPDYKNKAKKEGWLKDVASSIGLTPKQIMTRFQTMRTEYFKLKRKVAGKSGQGQTKLTPLQDFKLRRYKFLDAHYRGKASSRELGSVPQPQSSSDEADDEATPGTSAVTGSSDHRGHDYSGSPPKKKKKGMTQVLVDLLTDSQKELRHSQATLAEAAGTSAVGECERVAWAQWLSSIHKEIPREKWRAYQKETFAVAMRYTGEEQQPPTPVFQPVHQHQVFPQQPVQYMAVPYGYGAPGQQHLRPPLVSANPPTTTMSTLRAETTTLQNAGPEGSEKEVSAEE
ncbi:uncharacterized protein [Branchiostoma lanceolatum]|uniref:uncharacterized protein n=1 Tax=Branchiostoma lanceolatum TaxID=7740 RepID=UPI003451FD67